MDGITKFLRQFIKTKEGAHLTRNVGLVSMATLAILLVFFDPLIFGAFVFSALISCAGVLMMDDYEKNPPTAVTEAPSADEEKENGGKDIETDESR